MNLKKLFYSLCFFLTFIAADVYADKTIDLAPKFTEGKSYKYQTNVDLSIDQKMPKPYAGDINYKGLVNIKVDYNIEKVHEDRSADIKITLMEPKIRFSMSSKGEDESMNFSFKFDSSEHSENEMQEIHAARSLLDCLDQTSLVVRMTPEGKVVHVKGLEETTHQFQEKMKNEKLLPENNVKDICSMITPKTAEYLVYSITNFLPGKPVKVGQSWDKKTPIGNMTIQQTWTLKSASDKTIIVDEAAAVEMGKSDNPMLKYESLKGEGKGTISLNGQDHWVEKQESEFHFEGKQSIEIPSSEKPLEIETSIKGDASFKRV